MLALIAGQGALPSVLVERLSQRPFVAAVEGHIPDDVAPDMVFRLETLGSLIETFQSRGITQVCFAGAITRPEVDPSRIDAATAPLIPQITAALQKGDDGALRVVLSLFEEAGISIVSAVDICPDLLPKPGVITQRQPTLDHRADAARASGMMDGIGAFDIGQSCVVHKGQVLVIEGKFGTEWMLGTLARRPDGPGGVFYKAAKPDQDRRVDVPVVGPRTVAQVANAGLDGLVVQGGGVIILQYDDVVRRANEAGLFLWVRDPDDPDSV